MIVGIDKDEIVVNKGNARAFLVMCVDLSKSKEEHYQTIFEAALLKGTFKTKIDIDSAYNFYAKRIPGLADNVIALATCVSEEGNFQIESATRLKTNILQNGAIFLPEYYQEKILYNRVIDDRGTVEVIRECSRNSLVDSFFSTLPYVLYQPKENGLKVLPIRLCPECREPFLARRWDQGFCNQQHSQRWRAREYYKNKKKS